MADQRKTTPVLGDAPAALDRARQWVEHACQRPHWKIEIALLCGVMVIFVAFPALNNIRDAHGAGSTWSVVKQQIATPLSPYVSSDPESHNAKRTFRLAVPMLFKLLNVHAVWLMYSVQLVVTLFLFWTVISLAARDSGNRLVAVTLSFGFAFAYLGQQGITDTLAKFDVYAITCMLSAMYFRRSVATFLLLTFALWTDERAIAGCGMVYLYFQLFEQRPEQRPLLALIKPVRNSCAVIAALACYGCLRLALAHYFGFKAVIGDIGPSYLLAQMNMLTFGLWSAFEGFWLLILVALACLYKQRSFALLMGVLLVAAIQIITAFSVVDITRSLIYMAPLVFIALHVGAQHERTRELEVLCLLVLLACILVPTYFAEGGFRIEGSNPLLVKLVSWIGSGFAGIH